MDEQVKKIKSYWDEKAALYKDPRATTNDYWLRELEIKNIKEVLDKIKAKKRILDVGCGDGYSIIELSKKIINS